jgi:lipopolysaccharide/colanic/teichoic acid biosynthesis glycosyltransferase
MPKRLFDLLGASLALLLLSPLMLAIAAAIKLDSRGPVFFRQQRVGRHGVPFLIHKFRTMVANAQGGRIVRHVHRHLGPRAGADGGR